MKYLEDLNMVPTDLIGLNAHTRKILFWAIVTLAIVPLNTSLAQREILKSIPPTMADVLFYMNKYRQLPEYSQVKLTENDLVIKFRTPELPVQFAKLRDKWASIIGKGNWIHFHHFSYGIMRFNDALSMTPTSEEAKMRRKAGFVWALAEFQYIENSSTDSSFPLWSQLYMYESQIYMQLGEYAMAQRAMQLAARYNKKASSR
jgi:hypothetical protein